VIPAGKTTMKIPVRIIPDQIVEHDETYLVVLTDTTNPNVALGRRIGTGTILNDD
jgi:hypothetical protein